MKREDLFEAIGMVEDERLARCDKQMEPSALTCREDAKMKIKKMWLIAAVVTLMVMLMGSAIAALVAMDVDEIRTVTGGALESDENGQLHKSDEQIHEGEAVNFEKIHDAYIELGSYYPQEIPNGYTITFVSEGVPLQNQRIDYQNEAGNYICYWIYAGNPASIVEIYDIVSKTTVDVNGQDGILYEQAGDCRTLVWINEDQGYGFALRTEDPAVDLLAMANSTAEGEALVPTRSEFTVKAVEELGDYTPGYLPEGYEAQGVIGSPLEEGNGWYSYVRKWYINKEESTQIYFEYETYRIPTEDGYTDDAKTIYSFYIPGVENRGEEVKIGGLFGLATENHIAWADPESHVVYHLSSETVTGDELLKVAQSILKNP